jgi:hypothetical protein
VAPSFPQPGNDDFLFGLEKGMAPSPPQPQHQPPPVIAGKLRDPIADLSGNEHDIPVPVMDDRMIASDSIQKHIQDLQRLRIEEQRGMYRRKSDNNLGGGFPVGVGDEYYV